MVTRGFSSHPSASRARLCPHSAGCRGCLHPTSGFSASWVRGWTQAERQPPKGPNTIGARFSRNPQGRSQEHSKFLLLQRTSPTGGGVIFVTDPSPGATLWLARPKAHSFDPTSGCREERLGPVAQGRQETPLILSFLSPTPVSGRREGKNVLFGSCGLLAQARANPG